MDPYALRDGDGLVGVVRFNASDGLQRVHFRYEFKREGKKAWHYCGTWPTTSLDAIRRARDDARDTLRRRVDPNAKREADRIEAREQVKATLAAEERRRTEDASVRELYELWLRDGVLRKDGNAAMMRSFERDVLPALGAKPVRKVTEHDLRALLRALVGRGVNRTAVEVHRNVKQMFRWAEKRQPWRRLLQDGNPAELVEIAKIVDPDYDLSNIRSRVLNENELRELRDRFEAMMHDYEAAPDKRRAVRPVEPETQAALWLCLSTLCRIGELLMTEWRHVDFESGTWFIPKENVKGSRGKKRDHFVYLPPFALRQFRKQTVARRFPRLGHHERLVYQGGEVIEHRPCIDGIVARHELRCLQAKAAGEHAQPIEHQMLGSRQQRVAPLQGCPQRLMPRQSRALAGREQVQSLVEPAAHASHAQQRDPCRGQLDRERQPVEQPHDLGHRGTVGVDQRESGWCACARSAKSSTASCASGSGSSATTSSPRSCIRSRLADDEGRVAGAIEPVAHRGCGVLDQLFEVVEDHQTAPAPGDRIAESHGGVAFAERHTECDRDREEDAVERARLGRSQKYTPPGQSPSHAIA